MANGFTCSRQALKKEIQRLLLELFDVSLQESVTPTDEATAGSPSQECDQSL